MKTLLYNPVFINPIAYQVFPNLTDNLEQQEGSTIEPVLFQGTLVITSIHGSEEGLEKQYRYVSEIDFSEFSKQIIRIDLYQDLANGVVGEWYIDEFETE